ncbi:unnamed protein product, partial [Polarella glacialis]
DDRRWLQHLEAVAEADVEVFSAEATDGVREGDGISEEPAEVPPKLLVHSPKGQSECSGAYLLLEEKANGQPLWRKEAANRWLYSGTDGTWIVGGSKQQNLGFACRTGLLHLAKAHDGQTPDRVQGSWKRVDGKEWADDADIKVILPTPFRAGAPVQIVNSRRLQGRYGRLGAKSGNVWRTRLADGSTEDLEEEQLQVREFVAGEAWLRPKASEASPQPKARASDGAATSSWVNCGLSLAGEASAKSRPELLMLTLLATLLDRPLEPGLLRVRAPGTSAFDVPAVSVSELQRRRTLLRTMEQQPVIAAFEEHEVAPLPGAPPECQTLVVHGEATHRATLWLNVLVLVEESLPGHFQGTDFRPLPPTNDEVLGWATVRCSDADEVALRQTLSRLASASDARLDNVGPQVFVVGTCQQRSIALKLLEMADKEEARLPPRVARGLRPPVPRELESSCARLRVPQAAAEAIRKLLLTLEVELTVFCLWTAQKTDGAKEGSALDVDEDLVAGAVVSAKYDDGNWCDAVVVDVDPFSGTAKITWEYDGTTSDIDLQDLKLKPSEEAKRRRQRQSWLQSASVLAIFGPLRQRKMAAVKVMAA